MNKTSSNNLIKSLNKKIQSIYKNTPVIPIQCDEQGEITEVQCDYYTKTKQNVFKKEIHPFTVYTSALHKKSFITKITPVINHLFKKAYKTNGYAYMTFETQKWETRIEKLADKYFIVIEKRN